MNVIQESDEVQIMFNLNLSNISLAYFDVYGITLLNEAIEAIKAAITKVSKLEEHLKGKEANGNSQVETSRSTNRVTDSNSIKAENESLLVNYSVNQVVEQLNNCNSSMSGKTFSAPNVDVCEVKRKVRRRVNSKNTQTDGYKWSWHFIFDKKKTVRFRTHYARLNYHDMFRILDDNGLKPRALKIANRKNFSCGYLSLFKVEDAERVLKLKRILLFENKYLDFLENPGKKRKKGKNEAVTVHKKDNRKNKRGQK